jgi:hypothetical protein
MIEMAIDSYAHLFYKKRKDDFLKKLFKFFNCLYIIVRSIIKLKKVLIRST